jgi:GTP cyclohydrolase II
VARLLSNNPYKIAAFEWYGIRVAERVATGLPSNGLEGALPARQGQSETTKIENRPIQVDGERSYR